MTTGVVSLQADLRREMLLPDQSAEPELKFEALKAKQRAIRDGWPTEHGLRVHRALSWLNRAEQAEEDFDAAFIYYWIGFNAAYADEVSETTVNSETSVFRDYFVRLVEVDTSHQIHNALWDRFPQSLRVLLDNRYTFLPFWKHHNGNFGFEDWEQRFERSQNRTQTALMNRDTGTVLRLLFDRLYVLRNQLMHGGSTWNSSVNRDQVRDGARILAFLVPLFIDLMMDHPEKSWGTPHYPVVE